MNAGFSLLLAVVVSLGLSAIVVAVLWTPLQRLLATLCKSGEASQFWVSFTSVMLFLAPLTLSMIVISPQDAPGAVQVLRSTLLASLFGVGLSLMVVGLKLVDTPPRDDEWTAPAAPTASR